MAIRRRAAAGVSIMRRLFKDGANPGEPDSDHLHHVVHRGWALAFTRNMQMPEAGNAMTSVFVWLMPVVTLLSVDVSDLRTGQALLLFLGCVVVYLGFYRITHVASVRLLES